MTIHKKGQAHWEGDIKRGKGTVSTESGVLNQQPYGFNTRFEGEKGTNPEELIGAAHAACFSMALSLMLGEAGFTPTSIDTTADVSLDKVDAGFAITKIALKSEVALPDDASSGEHLLRYPTAIHIPRHPTHLCCRIRTEKQRQFTQLLRSHKFTRRLFFCQ